MDSRLAYIYIISGASLWGIIGIFATYLYQFGFTPIQVVAIRTTTAALALFLYLLATNPALLRIKAADSKYFVGTGIISIVFFNWCMFSTIQETSVSIAAILLYTAPAFVTILSRIIFKEKLTARKLAALAITFAGCTLVVGIFPDPNGSISFYGLLLGIGSGLFYGLYSIFGKFALQKYHSMTVIVYTFLFAAVAIVPFSGLWHAGISFANSQIWFHISGLGLMSTVFAFALYTRGLQAMESSKASILATVEPVTATILSFIVFKELLSIWQYIGIIMVVTAVILVQRPARSRRHQLT
ncbi:DMT family transporter [Sediminibacillus massiliensis]|uniref:DMT family transporter n=1 Tax=Sediminibacillus massiliensis TaxID=1926277 RepID=UPI0009885F51|nr:DMT family transporter [Sediminibacillus massiliensis]